MFRYALNSDRNRTRKKKKKKKKKNKKKKSRLIKTKLVINSTKK